MTYWQAIWLGLLQAVTEFLPVSSSGHLVLYQHLTGVDAEAYLLFDVMLHVGTLVAVLAVYWQELLHVIVGALRGFSAIVQRRSLRQLWGRDADFRMAVWLILATIPAGVAGVLLRGAIGGIRAYPSAVGALLIVNGWVLFLAGRRRVRQRPLTTGKAATIGLAQAVALFPGLSRSGLTISAALACNQNRSAAARFSFLLSVPAILGAAVLTLMKSAGAAATQPTTAQASAPGVGPILVGMVVSAVVGYGALRLLLRVLRRGRLAYFGYYCWIVALAVIILDRAL